jgi:hypothetical protein
VLNPWTIQQLAKIELAKKLKTAELFRLSQQISRNQRPSKRIVPAIFCYIGKLMVSFGLSLQKRYGITIK